MRAVTVATHGHCFDGLASAVVFSDLYAATHPGVDVAWNYRGFDYVARDAGVSEADLDGEDNAILDYRYTRSDRLTYYFDHHATAFRTDADREAFFAGAPAMGFFEAEGSSCTKLIARVAEERFGVTIAREDDLVEWADRIDSARFDDVAEIVMSPPPALQLASYVERFGSNDVLPSLVARLRTGTIADALADDEIAARVKRLAKEKRAGLDVQREVARELGEIVTCDLTQHGPLTVEKFGLYALFPRARYTTQLFASDGRVKLSVGYNPWSQKSCEHHIGELLRQFGGGGHKVVGGASFASREEALSAVAIMTTALSTPPTRRP